MAKSILSRILPHARGAPSPAEGLDFLLDQIRSPDDVTEWTRDYTTVVHMLTPAERGCLIAKQWVVHMRVSQMAEGQARSSV